MGLFKKKKKTFYAMANGISVPMEEVPDEVFSTKMMGDGIAIQPSEGKIYSPCHGKVTMLMERTLHAVGIETDDGVEILIHIGLDTVNLDGVGFTGHIQVGDEVEVGDLLVSYDKPQLEKDGINDITMLVLVSPLDYEYTDFFCNQEVQVKTSPIIEYQ